MKPRARGDAGVGR